jgi:hypothetical protein
MAYAAYSRSRSRNEAQERFVGRRPGDDPAAADRDGRHQSTAAEAAVGTAAGSGGHRAKLAGLPSGRVPPGSLRPGPASNGAATTPSSVTSR